MLALFQAGARRLPRAWKRIARKPNCANPEGQRMTRPQSGNDSRSSRPYLLACDGAYATQLATCLRSMVESNRSAWPLDFHVLVEKLPETTRTRVLDSLPSGSASIRWIAVDVERFAGFSTLSYISRITFAR